MLLPRAHVCRPCHVHVNTQFKKVQARGHVHHGYTNNNNHHHHVSFVQHTTRQVHHALLHLRHFHQQPLLAWVRRTSLTYRGGPCQQQPLQQQQQQQQQRQHHHSREQTLPHQQHTFPKQRILRQQTRIFYSFTAPTAKSNPGLEAVTAAIITTRDIIQDSLEAAAATIKKRSTALHSEEEAAGQHITVSSRAGRSVTSIGSGLGLRAIGQPRRGVAAATTVRTTSLSQPRLLSAIMVSTTQTRTHIGHSSGGGGAGAEGGSGHNHSHDNTYLTSTNKNDAGVKITRIGLYVNLGMAIAKGIGGYVFNSKALTADAIHSLTDLVSDVMTLATVTFAMRPPNEQFPGGYGKIESLGSLGVSGILLTGGFYMGWAAVFALCQQFIPGFESLAEQLGLVAGHHHGADHSHTDLGPNINAAWLAGGSILIKEWLYRATLKIAKERKSQVLAANAYHHRVDSLTAFVALLMIGGSNVLDNAAWMDPVGGLVISLMVVQAGWGNTKSAILELADVSLSDEIKKKVRTYAEKGLKESGRAGYEVRQVQGVKAGQNYLVDVEFGVPSSTTVKDTKAVEDELRDYIGGKVRGVKRVKMRFVPQAAGAPDFTDEFIGADVSPRSSPEPEDEDPDHKHKHSH